MRLEDYLEFLQPDVIRLKGHRIGLEDIVDAHNEGETPEQIDENLDPAIAQGVLLCAITTRLVLVRLGRTLWPQAPQARL
jgi:hypothetical protein